MKEHKTIDKFLPKQVNKLQKEVLALMNRQYQAFAKFVMSKTPPSDDLAKALEHLRVAAWHTNSAIAHDWPDKWNEEVKATIPHLVKAPEPKKQVEVIYKKKPKEYIKDAK